METNLSISRTFEAYKVHLQENFPQQMSLSMFCRKRGVRYESLTHWMQRHGHRVSTLRLEALLKRNNLDPAHLPSGQTAPAAVLESPYARQIPLDRRITGVVVTFPDGISVSIRQTTPCALTNFIDSYNQLTSQSYVQPE